MSTPQPLTDLSGPCQYHLEFRLKTGTTVDAVPAKIAQLFERSVSAIQDPSLSGDVAYPRGFTSLVVGFGPTLWNALAPGQSPPALAPFEAVKGLNGLSAPSTQADIWVWLNGAGQSVLFDAARSVVALLAPIADLALEQPCFIYHDGLTFEGFMDGIANPAPFAIPEVALVADGDAGAGGSTVLVQRWVTDVTRLASLPVVEQEAVYGRAKPNGAQLDPLPANSHVGRTQIVRNGRQFPIYRRNIYFGTAAQAGYMFVGVCADPTVTLDMLKQMYGVGDLPITDRLLEFYTPTSGSFYFVPSIEALRRAGVQPADDD
jgi:putative iron-dependent peroxidase